MKKSAKQLVFQPRFRLRVEETRKSRYTRKAKHKSTHATPELSV